jgi:hypothetical protein
MQQRPNRPATLLVLVAAALTAMLVPVAAGAAPTGPAPQAAPQATLVRTHVFLPGPAAARDAGGKPQPTLANCTNDGVSSGTPTVTGFKTKGGTAHLNVNPATVPTSIAGDAPSAIAKAFAAWSTGHAAPAFLVATDGNVTKETANHQTDVLFGRTPGSAIAVTYTWRWNNGDIESDTVFSSRLAWKNLPAEGDGCDELQPFYDLQNIATHEFGHIYGLDHPAGDRFATMYSYGYTGETLKRSLASSDSAGINSLYP